MAEIEGPICLVIGNFDGLHLGHQKVIRQAKEIAKRSNMKTALLSFEPHPLSVLDPKRAPELIQSQHQKRRLLTYYGIDYYLVQRFDLGVAQIEARDFIVSLKKRINFKYLLVGSRFRFGRGRKGDSQLLAELGCELDYELVGVDEVMDDQGVISSTRVRELIRGGDMDRVSRLLNRPYYLEGRVVEGDRLGSKLGFPTANLEVLHQLIPKRGVYASWVWVTDQWYRSITNIGHRPTLHQSTLQIETNLFEYDGDLYDQSIILCLSLYLRDERKFESYQALRAQIESDISHRLSLADRLHPDLPFLAGSQKAN